MDKINFIREQEKKYHDSCYENYKLFAKGSWLHKPVKTIMDLLPLFDNNEAIQVLDLGAGVGRNSIPIAQKVKSKNGKVVCVDLLDSALEKLQQYSEEYEVYEVIESIKADIGHYTIAEETYDLIIAVSTLEHVESEDVFEHVVRRMALGTKEQGINCIIVNSEVEEIDLVVGDNLDVMMEVNMETEEMMKKLNSIYAGWEVLTKLVKPLEYNINRDERQVLLKTNAITYIVRKVT